MSEIFWDIIILNIGWIVTFITLIGLGYKMGAWTKGIDERFKKIEENPIIIASKNLPIKLFSDLLYEVFEKKMKTNPLTPDEIRMRREFTQNLDAKTITIDEAKILHDILQKELVEARVAGNIIALLAILLLIGLVIAFLSRPP